MTAYAIPLTKGYVALVDRSDFNELSETSWYAIETSGGVYAARRIRENGSSRIQLMHRYLLGEPEGLHVDHRDHNTLNNQRGNLREATPRDNQGNSRKQASATSCFKGVYWLSARSRWVAEIRAADGGKVRIGSFKDERDAALAYNRKAKELFGDFAHLNEVKLCV